MLELGVLIAVLVGVSQVIKQLGLPARFIPLVNVVLGIVAGITSVEAPTIQEKVILGIVVGLSASGLYDQSKIVTKK